MMSDMPAEPAAEALRALDGRWPWSEAAGLTGSFTAWRLRRPEAARREARRWLFLRGIFRPGCSRSFSIRGRRSRDGEPGRLRPRVRGGSHAVEGVRTAY